MAYHDFIEMPVWQLALEIVSDIYKLTEKLPKREDYALCGQLRGAAISTSGNIAEAFGRGHKKDKINFYYYSRGSAFEIRSHLYSGKVAKYFTDDEIDHLNIKCKKVVEELNKIIKGLNS
jgi:four helix bundle protein